MGLVWFVIFGAYALGFWYGAKLTREEADVYSIGDVMIVSCKGYLSCYVKKKDQSSEDSDPPVHQTSFILCLKKAKALC